MSYTIEVLCDSDLFEGRAVLDSGLDYHTAMRKAGEYARYYDDHGMQYHVVHIRSEPDGLPFIRLISPEYRPCMSACATA